MIGEQFFDLRFRHPAHAQRVDRDPRIGREFARPSGGDLRSRPPMRRRNVLTPSNQDIAAVMLTP